MKFTLRSAVCATAALALGAPVASADTLVGSIKNQRLVAFDSATPETVAQIKLSGFATPAEEIVGLDTRGGGTLYALTDAGRLYRVDAAAGTVAPVGDSALPLAGSSFGFDFNPAVDRIRITSDTEQNLRAHPDTGALAATDKPLNYPAGGPAPDVVGSAYVNPQGGVGTATRLYDIDAARDALAVQAPPNDGTLTQVGSGLGVDASRQVGFDIAPDNDAFAAIVAEGADKRSGLYSIDLATGTAVLRGTVGGPKGLDTLTVIG